MLVNTAGILKAEGEFKQCVPADTGNAGLGLHINLPFWSGKEIFLV